MPSGNQYQRPGDRDGIPGETGVSCSGDDRALAEFHAHEAAHRLGNQGAPEAVPALAVALNDEEPLVRGHAAWAPGRVGTEAVRQALRGRQEGEEDAWVREEIAAALGGV